MLHGQTHCRHCGKRYRQWKREHKVGSQCEVSLPHSMFGNTRCWLAMGHAGECQSRNRNIEDKTRS
jgi:hypothetical protein